MMRPTPTTDGRGEEEGGSVGFYVLLLLSPRPVRRASSVKDNFAQSLKTLIDVVWLQETERRTNVRVFAPVGKEGCPW